MVQCCSLVGVGWFWVNAGVKLRGASERSVVVEGWAMIWTAQRSWCRGPSGVRSHVVQSRRRWLGCVPVVTTLCRGFHMKPIKKVDDVGAGVAGKNLANCDFSTTCRSIRNGGRHVAILMAFNANIFARVSRETVH